MRETLVVCSIFLFVSFVGISAHAATVDLTVSPSTKTVDVAESFSLQIWAEAVNFETGDYWEGAAIGLEFNTTYLQLDDVRINTSAFTEPMPAPGGGNNNNDWGAGYATIAVSRGHISSDVRVATLDFTALAHVNPTQVNIADYFRDAVTSTKVFQGLWPLTYYNLGGDIPSTPEVENPIGTRGYGNITIPEPATICLLALGGLFLRRRKRA